MASQSRAVRVENMDQCMQIYRKRDNTPILVQNAQENKRPFIHYKPWHDKPTGKTFVKNDSGKCLHYYYFYFIDLRTSL